MRQIAPRKSLVIALSMRAVRTPARDNSEARRLREKSPSGRADPVGGRRAECLGQLASQRADYFNINQGGNTVRKSFSIVVALVFATVSSLTMAEVTTGQKHKVTSAKKPAAKKKESEQSVQDKINERNKATGTASKALKQSDDARNATAKGIAK